MKQCTTVNNGTKKQQPLICNLTATCFKIQVVLPTGKLLALILLDSEHLQLRVTRGSSFAVVRLTFSSRPIVIHLSCSVLLCVHNLSLTRPVFPQKAVCVLLHSGLNCGPRCSTLPTNGFQWYFRFQDT